MQKKNNSKQNVHSATQTNVHSAKLGNQLNRTEGGSSSGRTLGGLLRRWTLRLRLYGAKKKNGPNRHSLIFSFNSFFPSI
jgi:hypothetical protein